MRSSTIEHSPPATISTLEHGPLTSSDGEHRFIGSPSGIYFLNTVRHAFAASGWSDKTGTCEEPPEDDSLANQDDCMAPLLILGIPFHMLGSLPEPEIARDLIVIYFETWHPIFPFLHGPTFLEKSNSLRELGKSANRGSFVGHERGTVCNMIIHRWVFNIAAAQEHVPVLSKPYRIRSTTELMKVLGFLALKHDMLSLQGLFAIQLHL